MRLPAPDEPLVSRAAAAAPPSPPAGERASAPAAAIPIDGGFETEGVAEESDPPAIGGDGGDDAGFICCSAPFVPCSSDALAATTPPDSPRRHLRGCLEELETVQLNLRALLQRTETGVRAEPADRPPSAPRSPYLGTARASAPSSPLPPSPLSPSPLLASALQSSLPSPRPPSLPSPLPPSPQLPSPLPPSPLGAVAEPPSPADSASTRRTAEAEDEAAELRHVRGSSPAAASPSTSLAPRAHMRLPPSIDSPAMGRIARILRGAACADGHASDSSDD